MAEGGYDTASYIYDVYSSGLISKYGTPSYWLRYFSPAPNGTVDSSAAHAKAELDAAWDSGGKHLGPITSPPQSHLSGTYAQGVADAQTFMSALITVYDWVGPLYLPTNKTLYCWLDQGSATSMSTNYWSGWSGYVNSYPFAGGYPFYACLYCNPLAAGHNCSTIGSAGGCFAVWSSEPETGYCGYTLRNLPSWHASGCAPPAPSTKLWQFAEAGYCRLSYNVDMDEGTLTPYSFYLGSRP